MNEIWSAFGVVVIILAAVVGLSFLLDWITEREVAWITDSLLDQGTLSDYCDYVYGLEAVWAREDYFDICKVPNYQTQEIESKLIDKTEFKHYPCERDKWYDFTDGDDCVRDYMEGRLKRQ